jgi:hypothetical protein
MPFQKGQSGNPAGRPKGSRNKVQEEIKEAFALVLQNKLGDLDVLLTRVAADDPAKAIELLIKLSNRFLPELARTEHTGADGEDLFKDLKFHFGTKKEEDSE